MKRFKIEIFDEVKSNDLTLFYNDGIDREFLLEMMHLHLHKFQGNVKAFSYDLNKKKKTNAAYLPMELTQLINSAAS